MSKERLTRLKEGILRYRYYIGPDMGFDFNTLAEVGAPYQAWFRDEIKRRGWIVKYGMDLPEKPWVADFVVGSKS